MSDESDDDAREAREPEAEGEPAAEPKTLGLERWVQFGFVVLAAVTFFLTDKLITFVWGYFAEPKATLVTGISAAVGIVGAYVAYRHPKVKGLADDVSGELSKVTWPSRRETWYSTLVVFITSVIAAVYLGAFDAIWSAFTDMVYATSSTS